LYLLNSGSVPKQHWNTAPTATRHKAFCSLLKTCQVCTNENVARL